MNDFDPILTAAEVAAELRCSKSQVYRLMNGEVDDVAILPHLALGRKKVVPRSALERWKQQNISGSAIIQIDSAGTVDAMH